MTTHSTTHTTLYSRPVSVLILLPLIGLMGISCGNDPGASRDIAQPPVVGLTSPVQLSPGVDTLFVQDYLLHPADLDSVTLPPGLQADFNSGETLLVLNGNLSQPIADVAFWIGGSSYHVPLLRSTQKEVTLTFKPGQSYEQVLLKGEMNNWTASQSPLELKDGIWRIDLQLRPGAYEYLFVTDGREILDPANEQVVSNGMGGFNSVLTVSGPEGPRPKIWTTGFDSTGIEAETEHAAGALMFWQNKRIEVNIEEGQLRFPIPPEARHVERSFVRGWVLNESGFSNDLLIPLHRGGVVTSTGRLARDDWERTTMYFMMIDRFYNGNPDNDHPVDDSEILPKVNYFGGDLAGVTQKIKDGYFERLGINALWLSPITQNPEGAYGLFPEPRTKFSGYHGYWPVSSSKVDYRFGTGEELRELLDEAHKRDMNVILDYVANHVHELHPVYQQHPDWATDLYLPDGSLNTENWDSHRLTTWFDTFMPTLDFSRTEVIETMTDSALFWLKNYDLDGFRHDATKHIQLEFWRTLTRKVKTEVAVPERKRVYQIGETYGSRALIASYINTGMLDSQFDFNVYDDAVAVFAIDDEPISRLHHSLQESFEYFGYHNLMGYITGNQDRGRFISYAGGALRFDEDAKVAGWTRNIGVGDPAGYDKLGMLMALNMTIPGIPMIYYGDEIGMPGGNDPDNRRMMRFTDLNAREASMRETTARLAGLRNSRLSLLYGDFHTLAVGDTHWAYARNYFDEWTLVFFNKSPERAVITIRLPDRLAGLPLSAEFGADFNHNGAELHVTLDPYSFDLLTSPKIEEL